ncbi:MAG TPA: GNAT family N-acetyltransferase [Mycobacteriales bacterium]|nr:GNAT family N-acetyltransferase [Mycobacteriales bacterium]
MQGDIVWTDLVGHRVVVRRVVGPRHGHPHYSDVLGYLVAADADALVVRRADGTRISVAAAEVHRVKAVPPRPVRATRADVLALAEVAALGWPAPDTDRIGRWLLRAADGFTGRANSVLPLGDPGLNLPDALARVEAWYAERGLPARFQVPLPARADLDAALAGLGYAEARDPTYVLTAELAGALAATGGMRPDPGGPTRPGHQVRLDPEPGPDWLTGYHYRATTKLPPVAVRIMTAHPRVVFASALRDGRTVAVARAVVDRGWAGVTALEVRPDQRRQGLAGLLMSALLDWAGGLGAGRVYLQVARGNAPALAFYDRLGFARHHQYHYRLRP